MLIKKEHFSQRKGAYCPRCIKRWVDSHGLSWETFLTEGYEHTVLLSISPDDEDLKELLRYHRVIE